jgi:hypothetical protein
MIKFNITNTFHSFPLMHKPHLIDGTANSNTVVASIWHILSL